MSFAVNTLSQFMMEPRRVHWTTTKHILRYLVGIVDYGLDYRRSGGVDLVGFTDSDWAGSASNQRALSVVVSVWARQLCSGSVINKKQKYVPLSSVEAEYMAASQASCEALWLCKFMVDLFD